MILRLRRILWIVFCLVSSLMYIELPRPFSEKVGFSVVVLYAFTVGALTSTAVVLFIHIVLDPLLKMGDRSISSVFKERK